MSDPHWATENRIVIVVYCFLPPHSVFLGHYVGTDHELLEIIIVQVHDVFSSTGKTMAGPSLKRLASLFFLSWNSSKGVPHFYSHLSKAILKENHFCVPQSIP